MRQTSLYTIVVTMDSGAVSVRSAGSVIERVGSFLGVSTQYSQLDLWHERLKQRAQSGELGIHLFDEGNDGNAVISQLEKAVLQVSTAAEGGDSAFPDNIVPTKQPTVTTLELTDTLVKTDAKVKQEQNVKDEHGPDVGVESDSCIMSPRSAANMEKMSQIRHRVWAPSQTTSTPVLSYDCNEQQDGVNISANAKTKSTSSKVSPAPENIQSDLSREHEAGTSQRADTWSPVKGKDNDFMELVPETFNVDRTQTLSGEKAWNNYMNYAAKERQEKIKEVTGRMRVVEAETEAKLERLAKAMITVKKFYKWCYGRKPKSYLRRLFGSSNQANQANQDPELPGFFNKSSVYQQTPGVPRFYPYFTYVICIVHLLAFSISAIVHRPIATVGVEPKEFTDLFATFRGAETEVYWQIPNIWIGITLGGLVKSGAVHAPCLRNDILINAQYAAQGLANTLDLGCCEVDVEGRRLAGTTSRAECERDTEGVGTWAEDVKCSERNTTRSMLVSHRIKPCCVGLKGRCRMIVKEQCEFIHGTYFDDGPENCRDVNCLKNLCGFSGMDSNSERKYKPKNSNQQWRFLLATVLHPGIIQVIIVIFLQFLIGQELELVAGWLRTAIIYFLSTIGGLAMGAAFTPYLPHLGGKAGVFGELAALLLELIQSWKLVKRPFLELIKILGIIVIFLITGSLPLLDNWEIFGGLMFGALVSAVILPYITFGKWDVLQKKIMLGVAVPLTVLLYILVFYLVFEVQNPADNCSSCKQFNCASYTDNNCDIEDLV